jgi:hypothetical protein
MVNLEEFMGRITRCSTRGFVGAMLTLEADRPVFGSMCKASAQNGQSEVVGVVYDISVEDDPLARIMASTPEAGPELIADQAENRLIPIEYSALSIGYVDDAGPHHSLPPQPPLTMAAIHPLTPDEVRNFTEELRFVALVLAAPNVPTDDLLASTLRLAADTRPREEKDLFIRRAGKECARMLGGDLARLETILRNLSG